MDERKIKILIADDHTIVRTGLTALLGTVPGMEVVGEAKNGELKARNPRTQVLALTSFGSSDQLSAPS